MPRNMLGGAGATVITGQNQGGGNAKAGTPSLVGRSAFARVAIFRHIICSPKRKV